MDNGIRYPRGSAQLALPSPTDADSDTAATHCVEIRELMLVRWIPLRVIFHHRIHDDN